MKTEKMTIYTQVITYKSPSKEDKVVMVQNRVIKFKSLQEFILTLILRLLPLLIKSEENSLSEKQMI